MSRRNPACYCAVILILVLSGCVAPAVDPTKTLHPAPTATETETSQPTSMSLPTETPAPEPTMDPLTPTALAHYFETQEAKVPIPTFARPINFEYCKGWGDLTSDGKWATCDRYTDPVVFINQSNQTWQFSYKAFYEQDVPQPCTDLLYTTADGAYIYFSLPQDCVMTEAWFSGVFGVFRMNLTNGQVDRVLGTNFDFKNYMGLTYNVSISPTGRRMAYIASETLPLVLNILDLKTGENHPLQLDSKYSHGGRFKWSKDGTKLVLLMANPENEQGNYLISFAFLDILKSDPMVTFIHEKEFFWITAQMEVTYLGVSVEVYGEPPLFYDLKTGVLNTVSK